MKLKLNNYKFFKIKCYLKNNNLFFIYNGNNLKTKSWLKIEQELCKYNLKYFKLYNSLTQKAFKDSIFKNFLQVINGLIFFINFKKKIMNLKKIININKYLILLCIRINNNIYSVKQIKNLITLNYKKNIAILYNTLKILIKTCFYQFNYISTKKYYSK
jgi:ribosomal protein L10